MKFAYASSKNSLVPRSELEGISITDNRVGFSFSNGDLRVCDQFEDDAYKSLDVGQVYLKVIDMINDKNDDTNGYCTLLYHHEIKKVLDDMVAGINK